MTTDTELRDRAEWHASRQEWPQATACFESLLARRPGDADVLLQLSYVASLAGRYGKARGHALAAAEATPRDPEQAHELLMRLRTFNEVAALQAYLARLQPHEQLPVPMLIDFASQLNNLNLQDAALALLDQARRRGPNHAPTLVARGQVLIYLGRFDEARDELLAAVKLAPAMARAWWLLAGLRTQTPQDHHVDALRRELARPNLHPEAASELAFALHKSLDDLGNHEGAWAALEQGCRVKRATLNYRTQDSVELVDALIAQGVPPAAKAAVDGPLPVFIVGLHRSGTTLLEELLQRHSQVRGLGELYDFTSAMRLATDHHCRGVIDRTLVQRAHGLDFTAVGRRYLDGLAWRLGDERCFTDKLPSNFLQLGFIASALPQARIVHLRRDPMEVCFSNLRELFHDANPYSYDQRELGAFHAQYRRLMAHWQAALPERILDVDYADLVADPETTMRRVTAFCGLDFEPAQLVTGTVARAVATASAVAVRQAVAPRAAPKWLPYKRQLQPLAAALAAAP